VSRFQIVADHHDLHGVKRLCRLLAVSRSGFYRWREGAGARAEHQRADQVLAAQIKKIHQESEGTYGRPRINAELAGEGRPVNYYKRGDERGIDGRRRPLRLSTVALRSAEAVEQTCLRMLR
jgi:HTH-like domain